MDENCLIHDNNIRITDYKFKKFAISNCNFHVVEMEIKKK
jgi:hypothetical protein